MTTNLRQAAQQALEALEWAWGGEPLTGKEVVAIAALRAALAEPEQPVAWIYRGNLHEFDPSDWAEGPVTPLYTAPTPRKPMELTDEDIDRVTDQQWAQNNHKPIYAAYRAYARAVIVAYEAKQGEQT